MWTYEIRSIKKPDGWDEKFRNIEYSNCPVCGNELENGKKIVRGSFMDEVLEHDFRVCVHKACRKGLTHDLAIHTLSYDPLFSCISFGYQYRIAEEIRAQVHRI